MTTTSTINSGAINAVSFPGSQEGEALVELVGSVIVTCAISSFLIYSHNTAATSPSASGSASIELKRGIVCSATAGATSSCGVVTQVKAGPANVSATAQGSATTALQRRTSASPVNASAYGTAAIGINTRRSASTSAFATGAAYAQRHTHYAGSTTASASSSAAALSEIRLSGSTSPSVTSTISETYGRAVQAQATAAAISTVSITSFKVHLASASVDASADGIASTVRHATTSAATTPRAVASASALRYMPFSAAVNASVDSAIYSEVHAYLSASGDASAVAESGVRMLISEVSNVDAAASCNAFALLENNAFPSPMYASATGSAQARINSVTGGASTPRATGFASVAIKHRPSATTNAVAVSSSVAIDFAIASPAPIERQMFVQASDRRMEVLP